MGRQVIFGANPKQVNTDSTEFILSEAEGLTAGKIRPCKGGLTAGPLAVARSHASDRPSHIGKG